MLHLCEKRVILTSVILSEYTRVTEDRRQTKRQTIYYDNSRTLKCTATFFRLKTISLGRSIRLILVLLTYLFFFSKAFLLSIVVFTVRSQFEHR